MQKQIISLLFILTLLLSGCLAPQIDLDEKTSLLFSQWQEKEGFVPFSSSSLESKNTEGLNELTLFIQSEQESLINFEQSEEVAYYNELLKIHLDFIELKKLFITIKGEINSLDFSSSVFCSQTTKLESINKNLSASKRVIDSMNSKLAIIKKEPELMTKFRLGNDFSFPLIEKQNSIYSNLKNFNEAYCSLDSDLEKATSKFNNALSNDNLCSQQQELDSFISDIDSIIRKINTSINSLNFLQEVLATEKTDFSLDSLIESRDALEIQKSSLSLICQ